MKRLLLLLLACAVFLTACGRQEREEADAQAADAEEKTELVVATVRGPYGDPSLNKAVAGFNSQSERYRVKVVDYTRNGEVDNAKARRLLNTEIISGNYPDMLCFSHLPPDAYIARGLLLDLKPLLATDPELYIGDIAAVQAMQSQGGLYYLSGDFSFETLVGKKSRFGERYGWTVQEYLDIEAEVGPNIWVIYNMTHDKFLAQIAQRYSRTALDWAAGVCSFDSGEFVSILEASRRVQDKQESRDDMLFAPPGRSNLSADRLIAQCCFVIDPYDLAFEEQYSAAELSFIGWPTPDGSCGTDLYPHDAVGIVAGGSRTEGCWEFIKYRMFNSGDIDASMPMYLPELKKQLEAAQEPVTDGERRKVQMTAGQADEFLELLAHIENVAFYDETVMSIVTAESRSFFSGERTAAETAGIIQSKVSIYLSEQYG